MSSEKRSADWRKFKRQWPVTFLAIGGLLQFSVHNEMEGLFFMLATGVLAILYELRERDRRANSDSAMGAAAPLSRREAPSQEQTKKCPDCAETVLSDAKVCKHCNYRFATKNARCHKCQHVWPVLLDLAKFTCENCGVSLQRNVGARDA